MNTAIYHSLQLRGWPMRGGSDTKIKKNFFTNFNETITHVCIRCPLFQCLLVYLDVNHWPDWPHLTTGPSVTAPEHFRKLETHTSHLNSSREINTHILNMILWQQEGKVRKGKQNSSVREGTKKTFNLNWIMCDEGGQGHSDIYWIEQLFHFHSPAILFYLFGKWRSLTCIYFWVM